MVEVLVQYLVGVLEISQDFENRAPVLERLQRTVPESSRQIMRRVDTTGPQVAELDIHLAGMI